MPREDEIPPLLLSIRDAQRLLGLSRSSVYELIGAGALRTCRIGVRRMVERASVVDYVTQRLDFESAIHQARHGDDDLP